MYRKLISTCFSNKRLVLTIFSLALIFMLFGVGLYTANSMADDLSAKTKISADGNTPVSFPATQEPQHFLKNSLDYGHIVFRTGKHDVPAWNAYPSYSKQNSTVTTEHAASAAIHITILATTVSDKDTFYLRC